MIPHSRPILNNADIQAVETALRQSHLAQGPQVETLESSLENLYPSRTAVAVSSGTAALYISLILLELPRGGEVIIPAYSCNSLFAAVSHAGLKPVCADVDLNSAVLTAETAQARITSKTAAIIVPHTFGIRAPIEAIRTLGFPVIEDCAQALGGRNPDGSLLGSNGDIAVLSFFATKPIAGGEGGAVLLPKHLAERARQLRDCDETEPDPLAFNFKMSDIHAALIHSTLNRLNELCIFRNQLAERFDEALGKIALHKKLKHNKTPQTLCFRYLVQANPSAEAVLDEFTAAGIRARRPIWQPLHLTTGESCPNADHLSQSLVSIPLFPDLKEPEINQILHAAKKILGECATHE